MRQPGRDTRVPIHLPSDAEARRRGDLLRSGMSVEEAAARMGYSEPSAFSHAFKRWSGRSPESWRRSPATH
jgi:AraC-like DNA-binding protein